MLGARELAMRVRDGLLLLEEKEQAAPTTLMGELEKEARAGLRTIQNVVDDMSRQRRLWVANGMNEIVANPDAALDGEFSRARWMEIKEAFDQLEQWMVQPLPGCGIPPIVVISRRGNPPEPAPEEPTPEEPSEPTPEEPAP